MEFLNPAKKAEAYGDDPLRPSEWPADALFAITMLSSPLAWMELSDVPEAVRAKWRPLIAKWKRERDELHGCVTVPVGGKPDGEAWTGFVSVGDNGGGYALIFREGNARGDWQLDLRDYFPSENVAASVISGNGTASVVDGHLKVDIPGRLGYLWLSLSKN
jgi:alpha-galactosidase